MSLNLSRERSYGPGEVKVLTSADGGNFEESAPWQSASREEVAYGQSIMFETPRAVKAVTVLMRSPQPHGYFGISTAALIAQPGPAMLVSGLGASAGESCVSVVQGRLVAKPCLQAVAGGDGGEVFAFNSESQLVAGQRGCLAAEMGSGAARGAVVVEDCAGAVEANDGRSVFEMSPDGQLRLPQLGHVCLRSSSGSVWIGGCDDEAGAGRADGSLFSLVAVPAANLAAVRGARDVASLVNAAAARQHALLQRLEEAGSRLASCRSSSTSKTSFLGAGVRFSAGVALDDSVRSAGDEVGQAVTAALGVDFGSLGQLVAASAKVLQSASKSLA